MALPLFNQEALYLIMILFKIKRERLYLRVLKKALF